MNNGVIFSLGWGREGIALNDPRSAGAVVRDFGSVSQSLAKWTILTSTFTDVIAQGEVP
jgi:hypothetical protein